MVTWLETAQRDGPMGQVPGDRAKRCDALGAIRSVSECQGNGSVKYRTDILRDLTVLTRV